jgi:hypothetical protein
LQVLRKLCKKFRNENNKRGAFDRAILPSTFSELKRIPERDAPLRLIGARVTLPYLT